MGTLSTITTTREQCQTQNLPVLMQRFNDEKQSAPGSQHSAGAGIAVHIHMHVLPRWVADANFVSVVGETRILPETLDVTWERMQKALAG